MNLQSAVITGANRADGIGLALVRELRSRGVARVVGTYRDRSRSDALLDLARDDGGVLAAEVDVTSEISVADFAGWCADRLGRLDLLVNNAGTGAVRDPITRAPIAELEHALQVHGVGVLRVIRALLPLMGAGSVVANISSTLGSLASMGAASTYYAPAKALQNALTRQLAGELRGQAIAVFSLSPGWVATSMGGERAPLSPEDSARGLADLLLSAELSDAGTFRDVDGTRIPW